MTPVLEIADARARRDQAFPIKAALRLTLAPGDLALVEAADPGIARALTELCAGLPALAEGQLRLLGHDLAALPRRQAEALRGRIGLAPGEGGWLPHLSLLDNLLLAPLHHGQGEAAALAREAGALARHFGLPGVPAASPAELSRLDLARAACVRAFLGKPALLLLESPLDAEAADALVAPLRAALEPRLAAAAAALWMTRSLRAWRDKGFPATQRLRLSQAGLVPA